MKISGKVSWKKNKLQIRKKQTENSEERDGQTGKK